VEEYSLSASIDSPLQHQLPEALLILRGKHISKSHQTALGGAVPMELLRIEQSSQYFHQPLD